MQRISWSHSIVLLDYCNVLYVLRFHNNLSVYVFMHYHTCSLIYFTSYYYINHWFIHFLWIFCMMKWGWDKGIWFCEVLVIELKGTLGAIAPSSREKFPFSKGMQKRNLPFSFTSFQLLACYRKMLLRVYFNRLPKQFKTNHSKITFVQSGCHVQ